MAKKKPSFTREQLQAAAQARAARFSAPSGNGDPNLSPDQAVAKLMADNGGPVPEKRNMFQRGLAKLAPLFQAYDAFSGAGAARRILGGQWVGAIKGEGEGLSQSAPSFADGKATSDDWTNAIKSAGAGAVKGAARGELDAALKALTDYAKISPIGMAVAATQGVNPLDSLKTVWNEYGKAPGMGDYYREMLTTPSVELTPGGEKISYNDLMSLAREQRANGLNGNGSVPTWATDAALAVDKNFVQNKWTGRVAGLAGDVVTDPGAYVTGGTESTAKQVAAKFAAEGMDNVAARVLRSGVSAATAEELAKIGERGGLRFAGVQVLPHEVTAVPGRATAPLRGAIGDKLLDNGVYKFLGKTADFEKGNPRVAMRSGIAEQAVPALKSLRAASFQDAVVRRTFHEYGREFGQAFHDAGKAGWKNHNDVVQWLETADGAAKDVIAAGRKTDALETMQQTFKKISDTIYDATGVRPEIHDYFPRLYVGPVKGKAGVQRAFDTLAGRLKPGNTYMGEVIPELDSAGVRQFIEDTAKSKLGSGYARVFSDKPVEALSAYLAGVEKTVAKARRIEDITRIAGTGEARTAVESLGDEGARSAAIDNIAEAIAAKQAQQRELLDAAASTNREAMFGDRAAFASKKEAKQFARDTSELSKLRDRLASGDVTPEIVARRDAIQKRIEAALQKIDAAQSEGALKVNAQITKVKRTLGSTKDEAKRAALQQQLDTLLATREQLVNKAASPAKRMLTMAQSDMAHVNEMVRNFSFRQQTIGGWEQRVAELESKLGIPAGAEIPKTVDAGVRDSMKLYREAVALGKEAGGQVMDELRTVGLTEARAKAMWAELGFSEGKRVPLDTIRLSEEQMKALGENLQAELRKTVQEMGPKSLPADLVELAVGVEKKLSRVDEFFARHWDPVINWLKARQVATPGFALRNMQGGMFNNWLAGVRSASYKEFLPLYWGGDAALAKASPLDRAIMGELKTSLSLAETQAGAEIRGGAVRRGGSWAPWRSDFKPMHAMRVMNERVEADVLRGTMMWDTFKKDAELARLVRSGDREAVANRLRFVHENAMDRVTKFHFDYADLSGLERKLVKRVIPFYTFSRFNMPLQVEMLARQPQKIVRFNRVLQNLSLGVPADETVPQYYGDIGAVPTPFTQGGSRVYYAPDLPINQAIDFASSPGNYVASSVTPLIKTPIEYQMGKQFYKGIPMTGEMKPVPAWGKVPGLMPALAAVGIADKGDNGKWFMADKDQYLVEQMMPDLARARRLAPSDSQSQSKVTAAWVSTVLGIRTRVNTPQEQESELARREYAARDAKAKAKRDKKSGYRL